MRTNCNDTYYYKLILITFIRNSNKWIMRIFMILPNYTNFYQIKSKSQETQCILAFTRAELRETRATLPVGRYALLSAWRPVDRHIELAVEVVN